MDHVSKVHRCGASGKGLDFPPGGEYVNFILEQVDAHIFQELARVEKIFLVVHQVLNPGEFFADIFINTPAFLIAPMGGNTGLGNPVHFLGADLNFNALAERTDNRGMQ